MILEKLPKPIQQKIKAHKAKIVELSSAELLAYSKSLYTIKEELGKDVTEYLFKLIDARKDTINNTFTASDVICNDKKAIRAFKKAQNG
ncbi:MAG: hypothetical protein GQ570_11625 [Helicobacteraceae bacterium]|nr:hypothetical protein [Helicobacteraceae bacterium]